MTKAKVHMSVMLDADLAHELQHKALDKYGNTKSFSRYLEDELRRSQGKK